MGNSDPDQGPLPRSQTLFARTVVERCNGGAVRYRTHGMKQEKRIVWKLNSVIIAMVSTLIIGIAWSAHVEDRRFLEEMAALNLGLHSDSITQGIEDLMMSRNRSGLAEYVQTLSADSEVYSEIQIISHRGREVVASRAGAAGSTYEEGDERCATCHGLEDPKGGGIDSHFEFVDDEEHGEQLSILTPILNDASCSTADCHAHAEDIEILGFLRADYSLESADPSAGTRTMRRILGALFAILLSSLVLNFLLHRLLERPVLHLITGTRRIAQGDLDFEFGETRRDEFGVLGRSFNHMTARIRAHQSELREAMEYVEGVIESSADIIITVTPGHLIQTFNRGAEEALGYGRAEILGQRIEKLFADPKDRERALDQLDHTDNVRNFPTDFRTKSGELRHVLLTLSRLRDQEGKPIGTIGISKDITEERRLLRQVIQSKKLAAIGGAVTGIQHAVKNMLNALKGGSYLVRSGILKDNRQRLEEGWAMVEEGIERMSALSLSLLNYAKDWKPEYDDVDLTYMATKVYEVIRQSAADQGIEVALETSGPSPVRCDRKLVHMALMDIMSNAIDACLWKEYGDEETPRIVLSVHPGEGGNSYHVEVRDNGCGMTKEIRAQLFAPFFSTKKQSGTGLGLALTARVIDIHGGTIDVDSEPGKGTTFRIVIPTKGPGNGQELADGQEGSSDRR